MKFKFRTLVNRHHRVIFAIAVRILGDASEAEDAVQEVYVRLWKHIDTVNEDEAQAWLCRVAKNHCIDKLRTRKCNDSLEDSEEIESEHSQPSKCAEQTQMSQWLNDAIKKLKEPYKSLIVLLELQQRSIREAAHATQLSENQVKVYSYRARQKLRALLQGVEL